jgi:hypothetical protein
MFAIGVIVECVEEGGRVSVGFVGCCDALEGSEVVTVV